MISGTGLAQLVPLLTAPVLTRIYLPEDYGALALYMSITGIFATIATFQYHGAIILATTESEALQVMKLSLRITFIISILSFVIYLIILLLIPTLFQLGTNIWFALTPVSILFSGINACFSSWANRKSAYKVLSVNKIMIALITPVVSIIAGLLFRGNIGLLLGLLTGQIIPALFLGYYFIFKRRIPLSFSNSNYSAVFLKFKDFRKYVLPSEFINILVNQLPVLMISAFAGKGAAGQFNLCNRMLSLPTQVISGSVSEVFKQRASDDFRKFGNCRNIFKNTLKTLLIIAIPAFSIVMLIAPDLFVFAFGDKWYDAGIYVRTMGGLYLLQFIVSPLSYTFYIAGKQKEDFFAHLVILFICFFSLYFGFKIFDKVQSTLLLYVASYSFIYLYYILRSYYFSNGNEKRN